MNLIKTIYSRAISVLMKKPMVLWGISLLYVLLTFLVAIFLGIIPALSMAVTWLLATSMIMIYLHGYRGEKVEVVQLFECFKDWETIKRVVCGMGWMYLWVFLWSLIPVVGIVFAVIRTYQYRFTPYILVMEPEISVTEAIKVSSSRTTGYKGKMFLADFFVGVTFLVVYLVLSVLASIPYIGILFGIILFLGSLAYSILSPLFLGLVQAAFYEEISNPQDTVES